jgi:hypothetical protein
VRCEKCHDEGAYGVTEPAETFKLADGGELVSGPSYVTVLCDCRRALPPREGVAQWWTQEQVYGVDVSIPVFDEQVSIRVQAEVPVSGDNYRVQRRGNRYYPTLIHIEAPESMTLHSDTARSLARALIAAAEAAERVDDADTDRRCGHWAPCDCSESSQSADAVDPHAGITRS